MMNILFSVGWDQQGDIMKEIKLLFVGWEKWRKALLNFPKQIWHLNKAKLNVMIAKKAKYNINNKFDVEMYKNHVEYWKFTLIGEQIKTRAYIRALTFGLITPKEKY